MARAPRGRREGNGGTAAAAPLAGKSPRGRALQLGALSATVAASYVGGALRRLLLPVAAREAHRAKTHRRNAQRILDVAGRLKGGVMKAMQLLSYQSEVLPDAVFRAMRVHTIDFRRAYVDYLERDLPAADVLRRRLLEKFPALLQLARGEVSGARH